MRTLVVGDIHGGLKALAQLLAKTKLNKNDSLLFLGDYVDGWSQSAQVIQFLMELSKTQNCIFIKGNHDAWCEDWLRKGNAESVWLEHGGQGTIESYQGFSTNEKKKHLAFFEAMKLYHIDDQNRLFIHAGFTAINGVEHEVHATNVYYDRTLWEQALFVNDLGIKNIEDYPDRLKNYKEIYIGHTPTLNFKEKSPMNALNVWNVDTGAAFTGKLSAINIDNKQVFQSDVVTDLYPNEMGRNKR